MSLIDTSVELSAESPRREEPRSRPRRRKPTASTWLLYSLLISASISALFPLAWILLGSTQTAPELYAGNLGVGSAGFSNYIDAWVQGDLGRYLLNSIGYTAAAVVIILITSSLAGYALARLEFSGKTLFTFIILAVLIIPAPAMFLAQYKLMIGLGLTNNPVGYVLVLVAAGIPMSTLIMRSFFASQPKDLEEAAALDGASALTIFARIILPLARPGLAAVAVIQGLAAWNEYLLALVLFRDDSLMPIQRGLTSFVGADNPQQQVLLAATIISVVPVVIFYLIAQRQIVQGLGAGALK
jgi:raffinose/stachyose/melibiose transport system permease protein